MRTSTTPLNACSLPIGSCMATTRGPKACLSEASAAPKSARSRSSMLQNTRRAKPRSSARAHRRSVCTSTPTTPLTAMTAVSTTVRAAIVSARKLESPGVSIRLNVTPPRSTCASVAERLSSRFFSSSSQSDTVDPSSTLPRRLTAPPRKSSASRSDVLPAPRWPTSAMFLILPGSSILALLFSSPTAAIRGLLPCTSMQHAARPGTWDLGRQTWCRPPRPPWSETWSTPTVRSARDEV